MARKGAPLLGIGRVLAAGLTIWTLSLSGVAAREDLRDPLQARFNYSDVENFWKAFDALDTATAGANPFGPLYLDIGSSALADFVPDQRIVSADELAKLVRAERSYYQAVRPTTLKAQFHEAQIRASYLALKALYPKATFPPTYYVIGRTTSGGTASKHGQIIALEIFSERPARTAYGRPSIPLDQLPYLAAHELVHSQQKPLPSSATLLDAALREGGADFVGELISGPPVRLLNGADVYAYGDVHEAQLWREFQTRMNGEDLSGWLYGEPGARPQNLGYWMGHRIAKAYYDKASDKRAAVKRIIEITDSRAFLKASGYQGPAK